MISLPNFFIVGAAKCATTTFRDILMGHPQVYMSPIKEPHYFCTDIRCVNFRESARRVKSKDLSDYFSQSPLPEKHDAYIESREQYLDLFRESSGEKILGEASPGYLYSEEAALNIAREIPHAKILMILRHPVARAYSHYNMDVAGGVQKNRSFCKALDEDFNTAIKGWQVSNLYVELGLYHDQVKRYLDAFPRDQVLIMFFNEAVRDMTSAVGKISEFLNIRYFDRKSLEMESNVTRIRKGSELYRFLGRSQLKNKITSLIPDGIKEKFLNIIFPEYKPQKISHKEFEYVSQYFREDIERFRIYCSWI